MKGSLLDTRPTFGWSLLSVSATLGTIAILIATFDSSKGELSYLQTLLVAAGIAATAAVAGIVLPPWADTRDRARAQNRTAQHAVSTVTARGVYDWSAQGL